MSYTLHGASPELWAWVKSRAHLAGLTINKWILITLLEEQNRQRKEDIEFKFIPSRKKESSNP